jgi:DNA-binding response OmpR family regulator
MRKILLVEDSPELSELIVAELAKDGFEVCPAASAEAGLALAGQTHPEAIILDWMLPGMDGLEFLRRIRSVSAVPVLMLTARKEEIDRVIGLELGADDYLTKPFGMRELVARLHALLRRLDHVRQILAADRQAAPSHVQYGQIAFSPDTLLAQAGDLQVELTRTEAALLGLFINNPGRVFNRAYLQETVWEQAYMPGDRLVDNAILRLRKKLGPPGDEIEAVWGVGYRLKQIP